MRWMRLLSLAAVEALCLAQADATLAPGNPPLTRNMVVKLADTLASVLDAHLSREQFDRFQAGVVRYWTAQDRASMDRVLANLRYAGHTEELLSLKSRGQQAIVDSLRLDTADPASVALLEAYDATHPHASRRARTLADLAGTWKRQDSLMADRHRDGRIVGVSFTDTGALDIQPGGRFRHVQAHNHYSGSGGCSRLDGITEEGTLSLEGVDLVFDIRSGSHLVDDGCGAQPRVRTPIAPRRESFPWSLRTNPDRGNERTLCWNTTPGHAVCYARQSP
jgi:hypothetical protein